MKYLLPALWVCALIIGGFLLGQNVVGWLLTAFVGFLIYPRFWDERAEHGKRSFAGARAVIAVVFTVFMIGAAWHRGTLGAAKADANSEHVADMLTNTDLDILKLSLRDPDSAQFAGIHNVTKDGKDVTCGLVNARNGFGGMTGSQPFAVVNHNRAVLTDMGSDAILEIAKLCG